MTRVSPSKPSRKQPKPLREVPVGSSEGSHFTLDDCNEPTICSPVDVQFVASTVPARFLPYDTVDRAHVLSSSRGRHVCTVAERNARARSFPPATIPPGSLYPMVCDFYVNAPLASPETLSESSSLASCGSNSIMYQRVVSCGPAPHMDPILQSPSRSANSRDCCLFLEASDIVGELSVLSPSVEHLPLPLNPQRLTTSRTTDTNNSIAAATSAEEFSLANHVVSSTEHLLDDELFDNSLSNVQPVSSFTQCSSFDVVPAIPVHLEQHFVACSESAPVNMRRTNSVTVSIGSSLSVSSSHSAVMKFRRVLVEDDHKSVLSTNECGCDLEHELVICDRVNWQETTETQPAAVVSVSNVVE